MPEKRQTIEILMREVSPRLWNYCLRLMQVEEAFRTLKSDRAIPPIFHQEERRIEAHVFIAFLAG